MYRQVKESKLNPNDRFIPRRIPTMTNMNNEEDSQELYKNDFNKNAEFVNYAKVRYSRANYQRALREVLMPLETRVLNFFSPKKYVPQQQTTTKETWPVKPRSKPEIGPPMRVLDMPQFDSNICHQVADWSSNNCLAIIFENEIYMQSPESELTGGTTNTNGRVMHAVKWRPDGMQLAVGLFPNKLGIWDIFGRKLICEAVCSKFCSVYSLEWVDNNCLVSGCSNGFIRIMSPNLEELKKRLFHKDAIISIKTSCDKRYLATSSIDKTVTVWNVPEFSTHVVLNFPAVVKAIAWHPWKNGILATGISRVVIWNVNINKRVATESKIYKNSSVDSLAFNPISGELVVSHYVACGPERGKGAGIVSVLSNIDDVVEELHIHQGPILYLLWGNKGKFLASVSADEKLCIWEFFPSTNNHLHNKNQKVNKASTKGFDTMSLFGTIR